jgi:hypothetical protein
MIRKVIKITNILLSPSFYKGGEGIGRRGEP